MCARNVNTFDIMVLIENTKSFKAAPVRFEQLPLATFRTIWIIFLEV